MKIVVPDYYKDFKCIAGACEDTCCAGWEVDVDEESFRRYKSVEGDLGNRLADVMIPKEEGEGCTFRLTPDKRCPFLNEKNLCDIYTELGESALCETCTYFPRFVHDYGSVREIGPAPSCFTAALLMVNRSGKTLLESHEDPSVPVCPNDIDPQNYFLLRDFREEALKILWKEGTGQSCLSDLPERIAGILKKAEKLQMSRLEGGQVACQSGDSPRSAQPDLPALWLSPFDGMEVINNDWNVMLNEHESLCKAAVDVGMRRFYESFTKKVTFAEEAFRQLVFYYLYRYVLEAVHDGRLLCAVKTAAVAYVSVKRLCVARFCVRGGLSRDEMADIFHLYSRQIEHSDVNFEYYRNAYDTKPEYGIEAILKALRESA